MQIRPQPGLMEFDTHSVPTVQGHVLNGDRTAAPSSIHSMTDSGSVAGSATA